MAASGVIPGIPKLFGLYPEPENVVEKKYDFFKMMDELINPMVENMGLNTELIPVFNEYEEFISLLDKDDTRSMIEERSDLKESMTEYHEGAFKMVSALAKDDELIENKTIIFDTITKVDEIFSDIDDISVLKTEEEFCERMESIKSLLSDDDENYSVIVTGLALSGVQNRFKELTGKTFPDGLTCN
jgi:hypothetical protein